MKKLIGLCMMAMVMNALSGCKDEFDNPVENDSDANGTELPEIENVELKNFSSTGCNVLWFEKVT